jgi:5-methylcytosine-specific restriction endonuclease McrA
MSKPEYHRAYNRQRYYKKRQEFIELLGGACVSCGAGTKLEFDHVEASTKAFDIGKYMLVCSHAALLAELKKCQLLCTACHKAKTALKKDGFAKKARGERVSTSVLKESDVLEIRTLIRSGLTQKEIAARYNVRRETIGHIARGVTWKHLPL